MRIPNIIGLVSLTCVSALLGGCASIFNSGAKTVEIRSEPEGATATVTKLNGGVVTVQKTPCTVPLSARGGYFRPQRYLVTLEMPGYETVKIEIQNRVSGWYFGNILLGGAVGMVIVDPATGAMWNLEPTKIEQKLSPTQAAALQTGEQFLVVLESDLTSGERSSMRRIQ